ncbi:MAG: hypothetical protein M3O22_05605 [Pseudomonadota bacterium]|nr:hypothetical protein [Pseudomonadota bacterium]
MLPKEILAPYLGTMLWNQIDEIWDKKRRETLSLFEEAFAAALVGPREFETFLDKNVEDGRIKGEGISDSQRSLLEQLLVANCFEFQGLDWRFSKPAFNALRLWLEKCKFSNEPDGNGTRPEHWLTFTGFGVLKTVVEFVPEFRLTNEKNGRGFRFSDNQKHWGHEDYSLLPQTLLPGGSRPLPEPAPEEAEPKEIPYAQIIEDEEEGPVTPPDNGEGVDLDPEAPVKDGSAPEDVAAAPDAVWEEVDLADGNEEENPPAEAVPGHLPAPEAPFRDAVSPKGASGGNEEVNTSEIRESEAKSVAAAPDPDNAQEQASGKPAGAAPDALSPEQPSPVSVTAAPEGNAGKTEPKTQATAVVPEDNGVKTGPGDNKGPDAAAPVPQTIPVTGSPETSRETVRTDSMALTMREDPDIGPAFLEVVESGDPEKLRKFNADHAANDLLGDQKGGVRRISGFRHLREKNYLTATLINHCQTGNIEFLATYLLLGGYRDKGINSAVGDANLQDATDRACQILDEQIPGFYAQHGTNLMENLNTPESLRAFIVKHCRTPDGPGLMPVLGWMMTEPKLDYTGTRDQIRTLCSQSRPLRRLIGEEKVRWGFDQRVAALCDQILSPVSEAAAAKTTDFTTRMVLAL